MDEGLGSGGGRLFEERDYGTLEVALFMRMCCQVGTTGTSEEDSMEFEPGGEDKVEMPNISTASVSLFWDTGVGVDEAGGSGGKGCSGHLFRSFAFDLDSIEFGLVERNVWGRV